VMRKRGKRGGYLIIIALVLGLGLICTFVFGRSYSELALKKEPFQRLPYVPSFDPVEDVTLGISPNSTNEAVSEPSAAIRAIEVYPTQTILLSGGKAIRTFDTPAPATLHDLIRVVARPGWIAESRHTVTLNAALVIEHGSSMVIAAPVTSEVVMMVRQGVFLAASHGKLRLSGVYVHASDANVPETFTTPAHDADRPFVLAAQNSRMTVTNCTFRYLGRDWNSSYGLSWSKGSTGSLRNSLFEHDFIGVYSNDSEGLKVEHNKFYYNSLYGIDPHSSSSRLTIEYNTSDLNGRHGIIFSNNVTKSVVRYNVTRGNGLNGIMMDERSDGNIISHNIATNNKSDGIVMANSSNNVITANSVSGNRVGISVRGSTKDTIISGNVVANNNMAAQGTGLSQNKVYGNGGEWSSSRISLIWLGTLWLLLLMLGATWGIRLADQRSLRGTGMRFQ
jgi:poly(beta-D-mannuronate) C5 epimerase